MNESDRARFAEADEELTMWLAGNRTGAAKRLAGAAAAAGKPITITQARTMLRAAYED